MKIRTSLALIGLVIAVVSSGASAQQPAFNRFELLSVLETYLESLRQQAGIPGMSAAVVRDGAILWERGFGFQNTTERLRATPDTPYLVADMSGPLAAILLLQCVEQKRIELDEPVRRYGVPAPEADTTLRHLLSHTSSEGPAGAFAYSPERYMQLTTLMESCAAQPYRKSVSHRIINRLAMTGSAPGTDWASPELSLPEGLYDDSEIERYRGVVERMAVGYKVDSKGRAERTVLPAIPMSASGGLVTTVRDLGKLEGALDSRLLLEEETLAVAWSQASSKRGAPVPMGLGWFVQSHRGQKVVWHFGYFPNAYSSLIVKLPAYDLTFILLANSDKLSAPYQLQLGDVNRSVFATLFLRLFT